MAGVGSGGGRAGRRMWIVFARRRRRRCGATTRRAPTAAAPPTAASPDRTRPRACSSRGCSRSINGPPAGDHRRRGHAAFRRQPCCSRCRPTDAGDDPGRVSPPATRRSRWLQISSSTPGSSFRLHARRRRSSRSSRPRATCSIASAWRPRREAAPNVNPIVGLLFQDAPELRHESARSGDVRSAPGHRRARGAPLHRPRRRRRLHRHAHRARRSADAARDRCSRSTCWARWPPTSTPARGSGPIR